MRPQTQTQTAPQTGASSGPAGSPPARTGCGRSQSEFTPVLSSSRSQGRPQQAGEMGLCGHCCHPALGPKDSSDVPGMPSQPRAHATLRPDARGASSLCLADTGEGASPRPALGLPTGPSLQLVSPGAGAGVTTANNTEELRGFSTQHSHVMWLPINGIMF